jgi:hypothetical protein
VYHQHGDAVALLSQEATCMYVYVCIHVHALEYSYTFIDKHGLNHAIMHYNRLTWQYSKGSKALPRLTARS